MNILFLSRWCPYPTSNGSKTRILNILRSLCRRHEVTLITLFDPAEHCSSRDLEELGVVSSYLIPYRVFNPWSRRAVKALLSKTPRSIVDTGSSEVVKTIREARGKRRHDLVVASQVWMASYWEYFGDIPSIFEEAELGMFRNAFGEGSGIMKKVRERISWEKHWRYMSRLVGKFAVTTVVSEAEKDLLEGIAPDYRRVRVIPNGVDCEALKYVRARREANSVIFAGSFCYLPNYEGMEWFVTQCYPRVRSEVAGVQLTVTGDGGGRRLTCTEGVKTTGFVPNVQPLVASAEVSVAPIRSGGGTRVKVLEAMALKTPVVATRKAVEGLDVKHGKHLLIADDPKEFAESVVRILREPGIGARLAENAFQVIEEKYSWGVIEPHVLSLVEEVARG